MVVVVCSRPNLAPDAAFFCWRPLLDIINVLSALALTPDSNGLCGDGDAESGDQATVVVGFDDSGSESFIGEGSSERSVSAESSELLDVYRIIYDEDSQSYATTMTQREAVSFEDT